MDKSECTIYKLITELIIKEISSVKTHNEVINVDPLVKILRSRAFEVLLKKKSATETDKQILSNSDCICNLLAWQFVYKDQPEKCNRINTIVKNLENSKLLTDEVFNKTVLFLLYMQDEDIEHDSNLSTAKSSIYFSVSKTDSSNSKYYSEDKDYHIKSNLNINKPVSLLGFSTKAFTSKPTLTLKIFKNYNLNSANIQSVGTETKSTSTVKTKENGSKKQAVSESYLYTKKQESPICTELWPIVSTEADNLHYTWEYLDNTNVHIDLPFACESGPKTLNLFQKICNAKCYSFYKCGEINSVPVVIPKELFIKHLKYMLVGLASVIFLVDDQQLFYLKKDICIEALSTDVLKSYCSDLIFSGSCFRSLTELCATYTSYTANSCGYIFRELCESIKRYLAFYRVAALSLPETTPLLTVHKYMSKMKDQIGTLARICKVGPYSCGKDYQLPHSAELLTYLYQEVLNVTDKDLGLVLYSAFYPCCQIYFHRFLQRWLFDGILVDPYEEFLIKTDTNYTNYRSRIYWTRNFTLKQNALPEFLLDLKNSILLCGKTMNLLKLCKPDIPLCKYIIDQSSLVYCCLTSDQLAKSKQSISSYYVEAAALCGPRISLVQKFREREEDYQIFLSKVQEKQALTLRRIELQRRKEAEEKVLHKRKILEELKDQIKIAAAFKKKEKEEELKRDLLLAERNAELEEIKSQLVKQEANNIIKYYDELFEVIETRRACIEKNKQQLKDKIDLHHVEKNYKLTNKKIFNKNSKENTVTKENNSEIKEFQSAIGFDSMIKLNEKTESKEIFYDCITDIELVNQPKNLDAINANIEDTNKTDEKINKDVQRNNQINEAFQEARRNRAKIMNLELGIEVKAKEKNIRFPSNDNRNLTDAQKNKLKVMRAEYQMYYEPTTKDITLDNSHKITENTILNTDLFSSNIQTNMASPGQELIMNDMHRNNILSLPKHIEQLNISNKEIPNSNFIDTLAVENEVTPMSIGSTPNTECFTDFPTPSSYKLFLNTDTTLNTACTLDTANSVFTDDGFKFPSIEPKKNNTNEYLIQNTSQFKYTNSPAQSVKQMKLSKSEVHNIFNSNIKYLLHQSVFIPLEAQMQLVNSEILKYFLDDQNLFSHLHSLRCYYFLLDGEFGRHITEGIFNKLYEVNKPIDLLNGRCLQLIMNKALCASSKVHENSERLSFTIQNIPQKFDLSSADVLDCLSMSYRITWPLNILLPIDTLEKYELVFKYLLKLHHISWILQKIFQELKISSWKGKDLDCNVLSHSTQYHRLQLYRHVMTNFIQTLQNYTVSEVLQASWEELQHNMESVNTLDQLYTVHITYLKTIIFRCLLNKQCAPIMKVINEIFVVILKFYNQLRSRTWKLSENDEFIHPSYKKLEDIFKKFEEYTNFVFRVGHKMARVGYQPHLVQMLDMLNMNSYYTKK